MNGVCCCHANHLCSLLRQRWPGVGGGVKVCNANMVVSLSKEQPQTARNFNVNYYCFCFSVHCFFFFLFGRRCRRQFIVITQFRNCMYSLMPHWQWAGGRERDESPGEQKKDRRDELMKTHTHRNQPFGVLALLTGNLDFHFYWCSFDVRSILAMAPAIYSPAVLPFVSWDSMHGTSGCYWWTSNYFLAANYRYQFDCLEQWRKRWQLRQATCRRQPIRLCRCNEVRVHKWAVHERVHDNKAVKRIPCIVRLSLSCTCTCAARTLNMQTRRHRPCTEPSIYNA